MQLTYSHNRVFSRVDFCGLVSTRKHELSVARQYANPVQHFLVNLLVDCLATKEEWS